jgi:hypothetical protein
VFARSLTTGSIVPLWRAVSLPVVSPVVAFARSAPRPSRASRKPFLNTYELLRLLARLQPKGEYLKLAERVVLDVWRGRQTGLADERKALEQRIEDLKEKRDRVFGAYVYDRVISEELYREHSERLNQDIALAEIALQEARTEELDVQGVLDFAQILLCDADRLWHEASLEHKQRMLEVIFPKGLAFSRAEGFGTPETCFAFNWLPADWYEIEEMASPTGIGNTGTDRWAVAVGVVVQGDWWRPQRGRGSLSGRLALPAHRELAFVLLATLAALPRRELRAQRGSSCLELRDHGPRLFYLVLGHQNPCGGLAASINQERG